MNQWSWPLPNAVPWEVPHGSNPSAYRPDDGVFSVTLYGPLGHPVCAVEDSFVRDFSKLPIGYAIALEGESGTVVYLGVELEQMLGKGFAIRRGTIIGPVNPKAKALRVMMFRPGYVMSDAEPTLEDRLDPTPFLRAAWSRVTDRFHRDAPETPNDFEERCRMVWELKQHPLWTYPVNYDHAETVDMGDLQQCVDFDFVYLDPTIERIVGDGSDHRNTDFRVWVEGGGWFDQATGDPRSYPEPEGGWNDYNRWQGCHDTRLDCSSSGNMESALIQLALRVNWYYDGREQRPEVPKNCGGEIDDKENYVDNCKDAGDGFCSECGYLVVYPWVDE